LDEAVWTDFLHLSRGKVVEFEEWTSLVKKSAILIARGMVR
jgi:hypothetical protein